MYCVDLYGFCAKYCEATVAKPLILLKAVRADCEAPGSKLLILLESCGSKWFLEKNEPGSKKSLSGSPARATLVAKKLMLFMCPDRSFPS